MLGVARDLLLQTLPVVICSSEKEGGECALEEATAARRLWIGYRRQLQLGYQGCMHRYYSARISQHMYISICLPSPGFITRSIFYILVFDAIMRRSADSTPQRYHRVSDGVQPVYHPRVTRLSTLQSFLGNDPALRKCPVCPKHDIVDMHHFRRRGCGSVRGNSNTSVVRIQQYGGGMFRDEAPQHSTPGV